MFALRRGSRWVVAVALPLGVAVGCGGKSTNALGGSGGSSLDGGEIDGGGGAATGGKTSTGGATSTGGHAGGTGGATGGTGGTGGATGGTGGGYPTEDPFWPDLPLDEFKPPTCDGNTWLAVHGLTPAEPVDYVALEMTTAWVDPDAGLLPALDSSGTPCATATDPSACELALKHAGDGLKLGESCGGPPYACQHFLVTTKGDAVKTYRPGSGYLSFLGPIDTPAEALLVAGNQTFHGTTVGCMDPTRGSVRPVSDGYEVVVTELVKDCAPIVADRVLLHVGKDGTVTELRRNVASMSSACI